MAREEINTVKDMKGQRNAHRITNIFSSIYFDWISFKNIPASIVRKLFWASIYLGGVVMTFLSCLDLHQQYQQYPISSNITTMHNKTITPPDASICLPFDNGPNLMEYFGSYPSENNSSMRYFYDPTEFFTNVTKIFFHENPTWQAVQEAQWPATIIFLAQNYFTIIFESETMNGYYGNLVDRINSGMTSESLVLRDHFIPQLDEWNVTVGQFKFLFGQKFLEFYPVTVTLYFDNQTKQLDNFELLYVTQYQTCYKLKFAEVQLGMDDQINIEVDNGNTSSIWVPDSYFDGSGYCNRTIRKSVGPSPSFPYVIDFSGTIAFEQVCNPPLCFSCKWEQYKLLMIDPSVEYISLPVVRGTNRCSLNMTRTQCENECHQQLIGIRCNCSTSYTAMQNSNFTNFSGTSCLIGHYDICLANFTQKDVNPCENQCLDICTNWKYDIQTEEGDIAALPEYDRQMYIWYRAVFIISVFNYDYILFQETNNWTMETIIGSIGGALGFWLGLDIVTIIYMILSKPILLLIGKKQVNNDTVVEELQQNSSITEETGNKILHKLIPIKWRKKFMDRENIKWAINKTIWSGLFISGVVLTTQMYINLHQSYQQNGTTSFATVMFNQTMTLPPIAICMSITAEGSEFLKDDVNFNKYQQSEVDAFMNQDGMSKKMLLSSNTTWPRLLSFMAFLYLRAISRIEQGSYYIDLQIPSDRLEVNILRQTRNIMLNYSLTEEEIQQKFAIEFEKLLSISTICENTAGNTTVRVQPSYATVEISPPPIILENSVCLHYPMNNFPYRSVDDRCTITVTKPDTEFYSQNVYYLTVKSAFSPQFTADIPFDDNEKLQYELLNVTFDYSEIYQSMYYKKRNNCSVDNTPPITCVTRNCRQDWAAKWCTNCTITLQRNSFTQQCGWDEYRTCLSSINITNMTKSCETQCFHACTLPIYSINSIVSGNLYHTHFKQQIMDIRIKNFIYPLMVEQQAMTKEDFVAACGGVLGFWLGLDVSYLVSIVFTPLMVMVGACIRKLKTFEERAEEETQTHGIKHRLIHVFTKLLNIEFARHPLIIIIKSLFERVFWLFVYAFFGYLTVQLCVSYCQQVRDHPVTSSFQKMLNQTITFPMTTFCVSLDTSVFEPSNEKYPEEQEYVLMKDLNINQTMFDGNFRWPMPLLHVAQQYLAMVDRYKLMNETDLRQTWSTFSNVQQQQQQQQLITLTTAVDVFAQNLVKLNITFGRLQKKFAQELLEIFVLKVSKYNSQTSSTIMNSTELSQITLVADTQICYEIPAGMVFFSSQYETISFRFEITKYSPPSTKSHGQFELPPNASWCLPTKDMTIDLPGRVIGAAIDNFMLTGHLTKTSATVINVADVLRILPEIDGKKRCSQTITPAMCKEECAVRAVEKQCGCTPEDAYMPDSKDSKTQKKCTWIQLKNCMVHYSAGTVSMCIANCSISCELIRYTLNTISSQQPLLFPNETYETCSTEITLSTTNFQYPIYSETFAFEFYNFVASLGGLLGIYLGIDWILLFEWIFEIKRWIWVIFSKPVIKVRRKSSVFQGGNRVRIILPTESP